MTPLLLKLAYQLRHHTLGEWSLDRWGITVGSLAAAGILLRWFLRELPPAPAWHWAILLLIIVSALGLAYLRHWAGRQMYVVFAAAPSSVAPASRPLAPTDKVSVRATAVFEVEGKERLFADLLAYWRTFGSREHAVLAIVQRARFLLLGSVAERILGMWYVFFTPAMIETITPGTVAFGAASRPALRVAYRFTPPAAGRKPAALVTRLLYLSFADEAGRAQVWADLLADG
jgi:hypothetical protein